MRTQAQLEQFLRSMYQNLGNEPTDLIQVRPVDGEWGNALSYEVTRKDKKKTRVWRRDLDDNNNENIKASLSRFF